MDKRIRQAFDQIQAGEALKEQTSAYLEQVRARGRSSAVRPWLAAAMACLVLMIAGIGGYQVYFTPTSVLSIEINPSVELGINRFDKVVTVQGYNEDGQALADSLDLRFLDYQQALEQLIASQSIANRLEQGEILSITVVGEDASQSSRLLAGARACTAGQETSSAAMVTSRSWRKPTMRGCPWGNTRHFWPFRRWTPPLPLKRSTAFPWGRFRTGLPAWRGRRTAPPKPVRPVRPPMATDKDTATGGKPMNKQRKRPPQAVFFFGCICGILCRPTIYKSLTHRWQSVVY